jgi:hypothetical protein
VGHASKVAILKLIDKSFGIKAKIVLEGVLEKFFVYSALGFAFIIIYCVVLSVFTLLNQVGVLLIFGFSLMVELTILLKRKMRTGERISDYVRILRENIRSFVSKPRQIFLLGLLVAALVWYFYPAIQLASYPGGDDRAYIFVARQIIEKQTVFIRIDYPYAYPYMDHILMPGFMVVTSFFYNLLQVVGLPTTIPILDLFLTLFCFSLIPAAVYVLTMGLSKNKEFSIIVSLTSLFMWKTILFYFDWGGVSEAMGYFLIPVFGLVDYELNENLIRNRFRARVFTGTLIIKLVLLAIVMYIHIYSLSLFIFLVIVVTPLWAMKNHSPANGDHIKDKTKTYLRIVSPYMMIFIGLIIGIAGTLAISRLLGSTDPVLDRINSFFFSDPKNILNNQVQLQWTAPWLVFRNGYGFDYAVSMFLGILSLYMGDWIFPLTLLYLISIIYLSVSKNKGNSLSIEQRAAIKLVNVMAVAAVVFFFFIQDSPFGWYYVPYPMAASVLAVRLYYELSVFMIYVEALPLYLIYLYIRRKVANSGGSKKRTNIEPSKNLGKHGTLKKVGAAAIIVVFFASIAFSSMSNYYNVYYQGRNESVVTPDDLDAFHWIEANTPRNATFFVNLGDAGGYIYVYTGRIVLPPEALRAWPKTNETWQGFNETEIMLQQGNTSLLLIQLLKGYNISYVYVGGEVQYQGPQFNVTALIQSPYFEVTFHQGGAWILKIKGT